MSPPGARCTSPDIAGMMENIDPEKQHSFCFVSFLLNVPVNNFSVISEQGHHFLGITSTFER